MFTTGIDLENYFNNNRNILKNFIIDYTTFPLPSWLTDYKKVIFNVSEAGQIDLNSVYLVDKNQPNNLGSRQRLLSANEATWVLNLVKNVYLLQKATVRAQGCLQRARRLKNLYEQFFQDYDGSELNKLSLLAKLTDTETWTTRLNYGKFQIKTYDSIIATNKEWICSHEAREIWLKKGLKKIFEVSPIKEKFFDNSIQVTETNIFDVINQILARLNQILERWPGLYESNKYRVELNRPLQIIQVASDDINNPIKKTDFVVASCHLFDRSAETKNMPNHEYLNLFLVVDTNNRFSIWHDHVLLFKTRSLNDGILVNNDYSAHLIWQIFAGLALTKIIKLFELREADEIKKADRYTAHEHIKLLLDERTRTFGLPAATSKQCKKAGIFEKFFKELIYKTSTSLEQFSFNNESQLFEKSKLFESIKNKTPDFIVTSSEENIRNIAMNISKLNGISLYLAKQTLFKGDERSNKLDFLIRVLTKYIEDLNKLMKTADEPGGEGNAPK